MAINVIKLVKSININGNYDEDEDLTDLNSFPDGIGWVNSTSGRVAHMPENHAYHILTVHDLPTHGFQVALRYNCDRLYVRTLADNTWGAWKRITLSSS